MSNKDEKYHEEHRCPAPDNPVSNIKNTPSSPTKAKHKHRYDIIRLSERDYKEFMNFIEDSLPQYDNSGLFLPSIRKVCSICGKSKSYNWICSKKECREIMDNFKIEVDIN